MSDVPIDDGHEQEQPALTGKPLSRRQFLKYAAIAGATVGAGASLGGLLAACGGGETETTTTAATTATTAGGSSTTAATTATTASAGGGKDKITIGYVDADTGGFAPAPLLWGGIWMDALVEDYNAAGGLMVPELGKKLPLEWVKYDSASDAETLIRLTEKCMSEDKVDLMFAPWGTSQNFAVLSLYEKYEYPLIAHAAGSGQVVELIQSGAGKWVFPVLCQPPFVAKYTADFMQANGAKTVGIIGVNDLHGIEFTGRLQSELSSRNVKVAVGPELYPPSTSDLSPIIKKLMEANVDTLWASTYPTDGALLVKQSMELGYSPTIMFMGPGSQYPLVMVPAFGTAALTGIMEYHGFEVDFTSTPALQKMAEKYKALASGYPGSNTIAAYVCYECLFKAVEQVGLDRTKLRDTLKTATFDTVLGQAKWNWTDVYLDVPGAGFLAQWQGGEMLKVVWPADKATAPWVPKPAWPKA
jgi:branched-chain amino acid transport system substrate-binding protein